MEGRGSLTILGGVQQSSGKSIFEPLTRLRVDRGSELSSSILLYVDRKWNKLLYPTRRSRSTLTENVARDDIRSPMKLWQDHLLNVYDMAHRCTVQYVSSNKSAFRRSRKNFSIDTGARFESLESLSDDQTRPETRLSRHSGGHYTMHIPPNSLFLGKDKCNQVVFGIGDILN
jgi:hypothetical protein